MRPGNCVKAQNSNSQRSYLRLVTFVPCRQTSFISIILSILCSKPVGKVALLKYREAEALGGKTTYPSLPNPWVVELTFKLDSLTRGFLFLNLNLC